MADTLLESEILGVWQRIREIIDLSKVSATDKMNQKEQLRSAMESPSKTNTKLPNNMETLIDSGFPSAFVENPEIRNDLLKRQISQTQIRGKTRYQVKRGTKSFTTPSGGRIRGGVFLKGKTLEEAAEDLEKKSESGK